MLYRLASALASESLMRAPVDALSASVSEPQARRRGLAQPAVRLLPRAVEERASFSASTITFGSGFAVLALFSLRPVANARQHPLRIERPRHQSPPIRIRPRAMQARQR